MYYFYVNLGMLVNIRRLHLRHIFLGFIWPFFVEFGHLFLSPRQWKSQVECKQSGTLIEAHVTKQFSIIYMINQNKIYLRAWETDVSHFKRIKLNRRFPTEHERSGGLVNFVKDFLLREVGKRLVCQYMKRLKETWQS